MDESFQFENAGRGNTKMCSVLFVDIVGYSKKTNAEQIVLKQQFVTLWAQAIKDVPPDDIMVVDAGDGAALTALVEPEDTIRVAMALRDATAESNKHNPTINIRMGINFGPVQLSKDVHGKACIVGDAINIAQRIMSFADPGQITISRSYYDVIKPLAHKYEEMFYYLGERSDKHVRHHHIYGLGQRDQSAPIGNAVAEGLGPIRDDDHHHHEEPTHYASAKAAPMPGRMAPEKAAPPPPPPAPPRAPASKKVQGFFGSIFMGIWRFIVSIIVSIQRFFRSIFWWLRFLVPILLIGYELLVMLPILDKPEAVKKELGSQAAAVKLYAREGMSLLGIRKAETETDPPVAEEKKAETAAPKHRAAAHTLKTTAQSGVISTD